MKGGTTSQSWLAIRCTTATPAYLPLDERHLAKPLEIPRHSRPPVRYQLQRNLTTIGLAAMGPKTSKHSPVLRDLPLTTRFLQSDAAAQLALQISDKDTNGFVRELPDNEVLVMALNEISAERGRGFFYYLPFREAWKKHDSINLLPISRRPVAPGYVGATSGAGRF